MRPLGGHGSVLVTSETLFHRDHGLVECEVRRSSREPVRTVLSENRRGRGLGQGAKRIMQNNQCS